MIFNREIRRRYQLTKNQLDGLVWRFAEAWELTKDEKGRRVWNSVAITHLEKYLATRRGEVIAVSGDQDAAGNAVVKRSDTLELARAFGEKIDAALAHPAETYQKDIAELKATLAQVRQELTAIRAAVTPPAPRVERRHSPDGWWDGFYHWFFLTPASDRRRA